MSDLGEMVSMLMNLSMGLDVIAAGDDKEPEPETDECCSSIDEAHEHGIELGWRRAMEWAEEALRTGNP